MPKKESIGRRLETGLKKAQAFSEKHLVPRQKALKAQFYPQYKPKRKQRKRKKTKRRKKRR